MNRITCSLRRPLGGLLVAIAFCALAGLSSAQEAPPLAPAAVAAAPAAAVVAAGAVVPAVPVVPAAAVVAAVASPARREETEVRATPTLAERLKAKFGLGGGPADLQAQVRVAIAERDDLRGQLNAAIAERDALRLERDGLQAQVREVEGLLTAQSNVVLATARQIDSTTGIPAAGLPSPNASGSAEGGDLDEIRAQMKAEADPMKRAVLARQARVLRMGA